MRATQRVSIVTYVALVAIGLCDDAETQRTMELLIMKRIIALVILLPSVALAQEADEISYDYFDFDYLRTDWDAGSSEIAGTGWGGRFSVGLRDHVYLGGEYRSWEHDGSPAVQPINASVSVSTTTSRNDGACLAKLDSLH